MRLRIIAVVAFMFLYAFGNAQPEGYYDGTDGLTGEELKNQLHQIIKGHTTFTYGEVRDLLRDLDEDPDNSDNVILIYSRRSISKSDFASNNEPDFWNREHVWPKSHGFPDEADTAYRDVHHLRPCDATVNSSKSNKDFNFVDNIEANEEGEAAGTYTDSDYWEPIDEVKGDVARMMFYMATRYNNSELDLELVDGTTSSPDPELGDLLALLQWHQLDPVSDEERERNEGVYGYQGNRNPFVDNPDWVGDIWGTASDPLIILSQGAFNGNFDKIPFGEFLVESYSVKAYNLVDDLTITVDAPFSLSTDETNYSNSITLTPVDGEVNQEIFVKAEPQQEDGLTYNSNISHTSTNATTQTISVIVTEGNLDMIDISTARDRGVGETVFVTGVVIGGENNSSANRVIYDGTAGIVVRSFDDGNESSNLVLGDSVNVQGTLSEYNNLLQIEESPITIDLISQGATLPEPTLLAISQIGEEYESQLVRLENLTFVETGTFQGGGADGNFTVTDGANNLVFRLGSSSHPLVGEEIPTGEFDLVGFVGQFGDDYQVSPRTAADLVVSTPSLIEDARLEDIGEEVFVTGVIVAGENNSSSNRILFDGSAGIVVRSLEDGQLSADLVAGDSVTVKGYLADFNGTLQISEQPITIEVISSDATIPDPQSVTSVTEVGEDYESELVELPYLSFVESGSFEAATTYTLTDGTNSIGFRLGISTHPLVGEDIPSKDVQVSGFISDLSGTYAIQPRSADDFVVSDVTSSNGELIAVELYPVPTSDFVNLFFPEVAKWQYDITTLAGEIVMSGTIQGEEGQLSLRNINSGVYLLSYRSGNIVMTTKIIKE
ncbi:MAG: endonuclease [bacterium]|nr:endonuclease [bacterium]